LINQLAQKGCAAGTISPRDRRARPVRLTKDAAAVADAATQMVRALQSDIPAALDESERATCEAPACKALGLG
jgi:DNA-binding MarR family transcriptional regulator